MFPHKVEVIFRVAPIFWAVVRYQVIGLFCRSLCVQKEKETALYHMCLCGLKNCTCTHHLSVCWCVLLVAKREFRLQCSTPCCFKKTSKATIYQLALDCNENGWYCNFSGCHSNQVFLNGTLLALLTFFAGLTLALESTSKTYF